MLHYLKQILFFTLFVVVFCLSALFIWGNFIPTLPKQNLSYQLGGPGHTYTRLSELQEVNDLAILFLGSSHTYRGFDTRIYQKNGLNTFNLGTRAQTPIQTLVLLKRYLHQLKPKLIIYEVYPESFMFPFNGIESALDIISNTPNDALSIDMALKINHLTVYNTLLFSLIQEALKINKDYKEVLSQEKETYIKGGFVETQLSYCTPTPLLKTTIKIPKSQHIAFKSCLTLIKSHNIPFVLVYAPISQSKYQQQININTFDSLMLTYGTYYNFNKRLQMNDSLHFYDAHHLNQNGVEEFNKHLIPLLKPYF